MQMMYLSYDEESLLRSSDVSNHRKSSAGSVYKLEISRRSTLGICCCCFPSKPIPLFKYRDAPDFLHGNPFVIHGYRGKLPLVLCLQRYLVFV